MKNPVSDESEAAKKLLKEHGLGQSFNATSDKGEIAFFSVNICKLIEETRKLDSLSEVKSKVVGSLNKDFGEDMTLLVKGKSTDRFSIVCKYIGCPFRIPYGRQETKSEEDGSIQEQFTFVTNGSHKIHTFMAHQNKDLKLKFSEVI